jgi:hypothetical protein
MGWKGGEVDEFGRQVAGRCGDSSESVSSIKCSEFLD